MSRVNAKLLKKERLEDFLNALLQDHTVLGPVKRDGMLLLDVVASPGELCLDCGRTKNSAKAAFFPPAEQLFSYRQGDAGQEIDEASTDKKPVALFGIRPCDAAALLLLDKVFMEGTRDPYYSDKRERGLVVAMACSTPDESCFCLAAGRGPHSAEGSDLLFVDLDHAFLVIPGSTKGTALLDGAALEDADDETLAAAALVEKEAEDSLHRADAERVALDEDFRDHLESVFDDPVWSDIAQSCLGCGICTYLCPTCHCFDICDEAHAAAGERLRIWDSCQFPLFTRQASGANPRPSARERFRQRIMHKFCYLPQNENMPGCVGCGRCVNECPVNLDIREVLVRLAKTAVG